MTVCDCETVSQHAASPGLVADHELIGRGAYDPMHFNKSGNVRNSFVRKADLTRGDLSVWRLGLPDGIASRELAEILAAVGPRNNELSKIYSATAQGIRGVDAASVPNDQSLCVKDDCSTDDNGGFHRDHATIALAEVEGVDWDEEGAAFQEVYQSLIVLLKKTVAWQRNAVPVAAPAPAAPPDQAGSDDDLDH